MGLLRRDSVWPSSAPTHNADPLGPFTSPTSFEASRRAHQISVPFSKQDSNENELPHGMAKFREAGRKCEISGSCL